MSDTLKGNLLFKGKGKDRKRHLVFTTRKGKTWDNPIGQDKLALDLRNSTEAEIPVELETDPTSGQPCRVRHAGHAWREPDPTLQRATMQGTGGTVGRENTPGKSSYNKSQQFGKQTQGNPQSNSPNKKREFHNPYNFIPVPPRNTDHAELGDREPVGHDRYYPLLYSGRLRAKMTVETPLLLPDTARVEVNGEHKTFPVRVDEQGKPVISPTAIKGMLRSAYEAVTNSRLSVFSKHDERLSFRMESTEGAMSVPARIESGQVVLYTGTARIDENGKPLQNAGLCAAWLPTYNKAKCRVDVNAVKVHDENRLPEHGEKVWAWIELFQHYRWIGKKDSGKYRADFQYWRVRQIAKEETSLADTPTKTPGTSVPTQWQGNSFHSSSGADLKKVSGYVCITGKNNGPDGETGPNIENKHDERLFFNDNDKPTYHTDNLAPKVVDEWNILIKNYRVEHNNGRGGFEDPPKAKRRINGREAEITLQWSRHIRNTDFIETSKYSELREEALNDMRLCYARVKKLNGKYRVLELYPVTISRRVHRVPPHELLPKESRPATNIQELSPADRVFGWVNQHADGKGAYRGQLRICAVECTTESGNAIETFDTGPNSTPEYDGNGLPLTILGEPKPQQGRFYVAQNQFGEAQPNEELSTEEAGYMNATNYRQRLDLGAETPKGLRGRKVYPHHADLPDDYWDDKPSSPVLSTKKKEFFREYRRRRKAGKEQRDGQNRSIWQWVKPKTQFEFDIQFTNVTAVELGALLWLLHLPEGCFHRFGGGKPLGFGSVKLELIGAEVLAGDEMKQGYLSLGDGQQSQRTDPNTCIEEFEDAVAKAYDHSMNDVSALTKDQVKEALKEAPFIKAFLQAARGFNTGLPIHYPRTDSEPQPDGKSYEWFVANNGRYGYKLALPNIYEDNGFPLKPED